MDPVARSAAQRLKQQARIATHTSLWSLADDMDQLVDEDESAVNFEDGVTATPLPRQRTPGTGQGQSHNVSI